MRFHIVERGIFLIFKPNIKVVEKLSAQNFASVRN